MQKLVLRKITAALKLTRLWETITKTKTLVESDRGLSNTKNVLCATSVFCKMRTSNIGV